MSEDEIPEAEQRDCCPDRWEVYIRHKHGTDGKLCNPCFGRYVKMLPTKMVTTMRRYFRSSQARKAYVSLIRSEEP